MEKSEDVRAWDEIEMQVVRIRDCIPQFLHKNAEQNRHPFLWNLFYLFPEKTDRLLISIYPKNVILCMAGLWILLGILQKSA